MILITKIEGVDTHFRWYVHAFRVLEDGGIKLWLPDYGPGQQLRTMTILPQKIEAVLL